MRNTIKSLSFKNPADFKMSIHLSYQRSHNPRAPFTNKLLISIHI